MNLRLTVLRSVFATAALLGLAACGAGTMETTPDMPAMEAPETAPIATAPMAVPDPDPREGLRAGVYDAGQAVWNMALLSTTPAPEPFEGVTNSDLAFTGKYAIQGNYNGFQIWDISNPSDPQLRNGYFCPASQSDVSVYGDLLFVSGEGLSGRLDCGGQGVPEPVSKERLRGLRIFDISDLDNPVNVGNVQTCRGSHTHTVLEDPNDDENVYVYISGSAGIRSPEELPGCATGMPDEDPNTALFRIEVIRVPLNDPGAAEIVSSPRIFEDLEAPPTHGPAPEDLARIEEARARGAFIAEVFGNPTVVPSRFVSPMLDSIAASQGRDTPTAADSAALRETLQGVINAMVGERERTGPTQCHDITVYPEVGLAGGACEGYGLLLDITDPVSPRRIDAVADSNFSYWHSATFNNDGSKVLFTDEWGGGGGPKCRATDPEEWGANAIFSINENNEMEFESYYKLPAVQTSLENCVAHNGSLIPIPGRDVMVQGWYQGGISVFDWTDAENPVEIAFFDRGPLREDRMSSAGSWSVYWYNGAIVSSEIARGLDILELTPSPFLTRNEIDAANTVELEYLNAQGQPRFTWPPSFALARAYADQLQRDEGLDAMTLVEVRRALAEAQARAGMERQEVLTELAGQLRELAGAAADPEKVRALADAVRDLATT